MNLDEFKKSRIPVVEIFTSISGEGISQGYAATFVRVAGCNLRCRYCDTTYSYDEDDMDNEFLTPDEILERVRNLGCNNVICTGGEPLETGKDKRFLPLYLAANGLNVRIETNGSCPIYTDDEIKEFTDVKDLDMFYALDVKCPGSGMDDKNIYVENFIHLRTGDEIKFVVTDIRDINYALEIIEEYWQLFSHNNVVINFSSAYGKIGPKAIVEYLINNNRKFEEYGLKVRLSLQIHKYIWDPEIRGV